MVCLGHLCYKDLSTIDMLGSRGIIGNSPAGGWPFHVPKGVRRTPRV